MDTVVNFRGFMDFKPETRINSQPKEYPKTRPVFEKAIDKYGREYAKVVGETNVYLQKQEQKEESMLYTQLDRYVNGQGDLSFVRQTEARYCDLVGAPMSFFEAQNSMLQAKNSFLQLPLEVRQKYGNDVSVWLRQLDLNSQREKAVGITTAQDVAPPVKVEAVEGGNSNANAAT